MARIEELIGLVADKNPTDYQKVFEEILGEKSVAAIAEKKRLVAESIYNSSETEEVVEETTEETEEVVEESETDETIDEETEDDSEEDA